MSIDLGIEVCIWKSLISMVSTKMEHNQRKEVKTSLWGTPTLRSQWGISSRRHWEAAQLNRGKTKGWGSSWLSRSQMKIGFQGWESDQLCLVWWELRTNHWICLLGSHCWHVWEQLWWSRGRESLIVTVIRENRRRESETEVRWLLKEFATWGAEKWGSSRWKKLGQECFWKVGEITACLYADVIFGGKWSEQKMGALLQYDFSNRGEEIGPSTHVEELASGRMWLLHILKKWEGRI